jgi:hypothetical protein
LQDNALASALGEAGHQRVKSSFSTEALIPRNEEFFEQSIHDFRKRSR